MFWRVAFPLAPFGAIASLSSERNSVGKSSALTMNRFITYRVCASMEKEFVVEPQSFWFTGYCAEQVQENTGCFASKRLSAAL